MKLWWVESALSSCLCGLLPLCELQMRAVVPYARHRRTEQSFLTRGVDKEMCGSRPWEAPTAPFPLANWRLSTFCGRCFRLLREQLRIHRLFRSPSSRNASRGDVDRKPAARLCYSLPPEGSCTEVFVSFNPGDVGMAASGAQKCPKSEKLDEAQALAKSCAGRPDFLPCDGLSNCATHSHGKCFKLHWCCHLGWCHCKFPARSFSRAKKGVS